LPAFSTRSPSTCQSQAVGLDHPVMKIIKNDHVLTLGHLGLICAHQNFVVFDLDHTDREQVRVELHLASIT
jgi:hypothetical protein